MFTPSSNLEELFSNIAQTNQSWFNNLVTTQSATNPEVANNVFVNMYQQFFDNTKAYLESQQQFYQEQIKLWQSFCKTEREHVAQEVAKPADKRFADPEWEKNPFFAYLKQSYLNLSNYLVDFITKAEMDEETKSRLKFFMRQYLDAISPTNFALTNPEVIKSVVETAGVSLVEGLKNMMEDMKNGYISMTDESLFVVGKNLAVSPGKVIFNKFPWVIEIDNVAVLAYYNLNLLKFLKPLIKQ
ncbi:MAG: hypothetical protein ACK4M7_05940, partial [Burkholderiales bacterium]